MKEYKNVTVAGMYQTTSGHFITMPLDARTFDKIQQYTEIGCKLFIRKRSAESIAQAKNPDTTPTYYLEVIPASEVEAYVNRKETKGDQRGL